MAQNEIYQASVIFSSTIADGDVVNVLHYELENIGTVTDEPTYCNLLAEAVADLYVSGFIPTCASVFTLEQVNVFNVDQPQYQGQHIDGTAGSDGNDPLSARQAVVATKRTGLRGRSYRGRAFFPPPTEPNQSGGTLDATYQGLVQDFCDDLINFNDSDSNEWKLQVYSPKLGSGTDVSTFTVRPRLGTIRGRRKVS